MISDFSVFTTSYFDRLARKLQKQSAIFVDYYSQAMEILAQDSYNITRQYSIKKLKEVDLSDEGQWRLRMGRFRFRYDIDEKKVILILKYCGLRREETYR